MYSIDSKCHYDWCSWHKEYIKIDKDSMRKIPALAYICNGRIDKKKMQTVYGNDD